MLLPAGKIHGQMLECGGTNGHTGKSLKVHLEGPHAGRWRDWADVEKGDLLDLWASVKGIPLPEAVQQAKTYLGIREEPLTERNYSKPPAAHPELTANGAAMNWLAEKRKIPPAIVNRFKVKGLPEKKAIVFPSYSPSGELLNHSYRTLTAEKQVWQDKGCAPSLWGWQGISPEAWEKREILICEGQIDAMTWALWGIDAVSIPNGGGRTWIDYEWNNLEAFHTIYLSFDMDGKSDENLRETINRLGKHRCRIVKLPKKDANDALLAGHTADEAKAWLEASAFVSMPSLAPASKYTDAVIERWYPSKADSEGHALDITSHKNKQKTFRFRDGELTVWTGTTGHGKSTLLNMAVATLAFAKGAPALIVSLETMPPECIYRIVKANFQTVENKDKLQQLVKHLDRYLLFYDRIGHIAENELFELMAYAHARYGVKDIVIDSLMRVDGMEENYPGQTSFIIRGVTFARETGCHVHLVAHPRKAAGDASPRSQDISGSGNIRNNADNVLVMWRNIEKERKIEDGETCDNEPDAILSVEKDRMIGDFRKFSLNYDSAAYRFTPWIPEPYTQPRQSNPPRKQR